MASRLLTSLCLTSRACRKTEARPTSGEVKQSMACFPFTRTWRRALRRLPLPASAVSPADTRPSCGRCFSFRYGQRLLSFAAIRFSRRTTIGPPDFTPESPGTTSMKIRTTRSEDFDAIRALLAENQLPVTDARARTSKTNPLFLQPAKAQISAAPLTQWSKEDVKQAH